MIDKPLYQNPLSGGLTGEMQMSNMGAKIDPLAGGLGGGFKTSFNLLQRPDENIERQYFYNKDLNKLFNMPGGVRMAAPKGFESVNKNQYEDFASKGATLQGASMFNDAMGGGYNLDLPRLTSGENSGQVDRNSPEFLYYYGDQQQPKLPPISLGPTMPSQEDGISGASGSNIPLNYGGSDVGPNVGNEIAVPSTPNPIQGIGLDGKPIGPGLQDLVSPATPPTPTIPKLDGTRSVSPIYSGDNLIATTQTVNPYQEQLTGFNDQLTGFSDQFGGLDKQFNTINTRLDNVDEGIASLSEQLQPQQQQLYNSPYSNFNFSSNSYSNPSPFGLGSLFERRY